VINPNWRLTDRAVVKDVFCQIPSVRNEDSFVRHSISLRLSLPTVLLFFITATTWGQAGKSIDKPTSLAAPDAAKSPETQPAEKKTDAERIVSLDAAIQEAERQLTDLKAKLENPNSEYAEAKKDFAELNRRLEDKKQRLKEVQDANRPDEAEKLQAEADDLKKTWDLAKERFDLAIQEQNAIKEKIGALEKKFQQDQEAVKRLQDPHAATQPTAQPKPTAEPQPASSPAMSPVPQEPGPEQPQNPSGQPEPPPPTAAEPAKPPSEEVTKAQQQVQEKSAQAQDAELQAQSITDRLRTLQTDIEVERKLLDTARKKADNARATQETLGDQARQKSADGASQQEVDLLWEKVREARMRSAEALADVNQHADRLNQLQTQLQELQGEQIAALSEAERKREESDKAQNELDKLQNPFSLRNLLRWIYTHGPPLVGIFIGAVALLWITRALEHRIVYFLVRNADHGTRTERENRAQTLASVFRNASFLAVIIGGILMALAEVEVNIAPLLGGAAVFGLAVAFGAQSLIKDYFYGFVILLENQYTVNDVIKTAGTAGVVERISLRMTVLRDLEGVVHYIPHGEAVKVSNLTHGWSRTVLDIGVSYREDADHVMQVLTQVGTELFHDPKFRPLIIEPPEILGLDAFGDSAIVIKLIVKTRPLQQWAIKREYLRRIKKRFDELGIEIPFPHRTIYHRQDPGQTSPPALDAAPNRPDPT
jgi:small conductance mechanosensitive channel